MAARRHLGMATVVTASLVLASAASAQTSRVWVDPPGDEGVPAPPAPAETPPPAALPEAQPREPAPAPQALQPARPPAGPAEATLPPSPHAADTTASVASREDVARNLAVAYL